jgi:chemotaxis protein histidine kinase CheA
MRLCLPLTLAIIDGFHVGVGSSHFIIPLDMVVECIELPPDVGDRGYLELREQACPSFACASSSMNRGHGTLARASLSSVTATARPAWSSIASMASARR